MDPILAELERQRKLGIFEEVKGVRKIERVIEGRVSPGEVMYIHYALKLGDESQGRSSEFSLTRNRVQYREFPKGNEEPPTTVEGYRPFRRLVDSLTGEIVGMPPIEVKVRREGEEEQICRLIGLKGLIDQYRGGEIELIAEQERARIYFSPERKDTCTGNLRLTWLLRNYALPYTNEIERVLEVLEKTPCW